MQYITFSSFLPEKFSCQGSTLTFPIFPPDKGVRGLDLIFGQTEKAPMVTNFW